MKDETPFKGSILEMEINKPQEIERLKKMQSLIKSGFENQPNSIFWKEALELINTKIK